MSIFNLIALLGGLGMFLYGMKTMGDGLEKSAGAKMKLIIESLTSNVFKAVLIGTLVTALIQSSSATTVMVVGFVNAGMMTLKQATGVIMGANIGTTVTAIILSLGDIQSDAWYLAMLKPSNLAPLALIIGAVLIFAFGKKQKLKDIGEIFLGFGVLFIGMQYMEGAVGHLKDLPQFKTIFANLKNPVLGILSGAIVTAIIQSSSASVGILQALAATGAVSCSQAVPIIMGQNIGTCVTALLSSIGTSKNAKRAAFIHLYFNLIGTIVFTAAIYITQFTIGIPFWENMVSRGDIAFFHTFFNVANTIILLPFTQVLITLANKTIKSKEEKEEISYLDERFLQTPSLAINQAKKELLMMMGLARENISACISAVLHHDLSYLAGQKENEEKIDRYEFKITKYLTDINEKNLTDEDRKKIAGLYHIINDVERIGDYADNLAQNITDKVNKNIKFTDEGKDALIKMMNAVLEIIDLSIEAFASENLRLCEKIEPLEQVIDILTEKLKQGHTERLSKHVCSVESGVIYLEMISGLERVADHCSNIGMAMLQDKHIFDTHEYAKKLHEEMPKSFKADFENYIEKYSI